MDSEGDAVAFVVTSAGVNAVPRLVLEPATHLWRVLGESPATREALEIVARAHVDDAAEALVDVFLGQLEMIEALEEVDVSVDGVIDRVSDQVLTTGGAEGSASRSITLGEGVPLCQATVAALLEMAGIRALAIKGPAFGALQVRPVFQSNDADVVVDPAHFGRAVETLEQAGWGMWVESFLVDPDALHSLTLTNVSWPCTLDVHRYFPGMLGLPQQSFEALWESRREVELAHRCVATAGRPAAFAIEVLHAVRGLRPDRRDAVVAHVLEAAPRPVTRDEQRAIAALAPQVGASRTLAPLFERLGVSAPALGPEDPRLVRQWKRYERFGSAGSGWIPLLNWRHPVRLVHAMGRYVWPTEKDARRWAQSQAVPFTTRADVLWMRLRHGVRTLRSGWFRRRA